MSNPGGVHPVERRTTGVRGQRARVGDITIAFDAGGDGEPLVLLHGFPHNRALWVPQLRGLSRQRRVITPDLRGAGDSDLAPPYTIDQHADDVAGLLDTLALDRATIGGISMGGYVALGMWRRHRQRVSGLVLANTRASADNDAGRGGRAGREEIMALARSKGSGAVADLMLDRSLSPATRQRQPEIVAAMRAMFAQATVEGVVAAQRAMMDRPDVTALLGTIDVPTLVVHGEQDAVIPLAEARAMHEKIAGSRFEVIRDAGHLSSVERPAAFNHVVSEFLTAFART